MISGVDFPIKSNNEIIDFFDNNKDVSFISFNKLPIKKWGFDGGLGRLNRYWLTNFNNRKLTKIIGRITFLVQKVLGLRRKLYFEEYYGGASWSNLSESAVKYLLDYIKENPKALESFKNTRAADEIWKQTILKTSKKLNLVNDDLRYMDWETGPPFPQILDITHYDDIIKEPKALFARKFNNHNLDLQILLNSNHIKKE